MHNATPEQLLHVATQYHKEGKLDAAEKLYKTVIEVKPHDAQAWFYLGMIKYSQGTHFEAIEHLRRALELDPKNADYSNNLGEIYRQHGMLDEAEYFIRNAIVINPNQADAYSNLALICKAKGDYDSAKLYFSRSLDLNPKNANTIINVGNLFLTINEYDDAAECFLAALGLAPENPHALRGCAIALYEKGEYNAAAAMLSRLTAGKPDFHREKVDLALITLRNKDFRKGFQLLESRLKHLPHIMQGEEKNLWRGADLKGKTIYIYDEKDGLGGFGDTLMFVRFVLDMQKYSPERVILRVQPELHTLISANMPDFVTVVTENFEKFDCHSPLLSLPLVQNVRAKTMPRAAGYLKADADKTAHLFDRSVKNVGIAFATDKSHIKHETRTIPQEAFAPLFDKSIKLHYISKQEPDAPLHPSINDLRPHINDFADTASVIANLDMVITADTSVVHLAGAMGKETALLLNRLHDWRWFSIKSGQKTVWYESVTGYVKEDSAGWEELVSSVRI
ncbi:tetratricopeptide repeat protein [Seleniivibrio woodruffii]|uniref:tetratricopeptide repeat protein n=1 Tax=Seleniivibrio woodruffii TaxID=1078050 RepID=UPI0039E63608